MNKGFVYLNRERLDFMKTIIIIFISFFCFYLYAHGEGKLGPHNGHIRMPASFHTELVPVDSSHFNVYLMDVNNQNAMVENSKVELVYELNQKEVQKINCKKSVIYFSCKLKKKIDLNQGQIILFVVRNGIVGKKAEYSLPLQLKSEMKNHQM